MLRMSIGHRMAIAFGVITLTVAVGGTISTFGMRSVEHAIDALGTADRINEGLVELARDITEERSAVLGFLITGDVALLEAHERALAVSTATADELRGLVSAGDPQGDRLRALLAELESWRTRYVGRQLELMQHVDTFTTARAI
jgi:CHASE3 domain sensor protein